MESKDRNEGIYQLTKGWGKIFLGILIVCFGLSTNVMAQKVMSNIGSWPVGDMLGVEVKGDLLFYGDGGMLRIADLANPADPKEVGKIATLGKIRRIMVENGKAYVSYAAEKGFQIFDISKPSNPEKLGHYYQEVPATYSLSGERLIAGTGGYINMFDLSDPKNPKSVDSEDFVTVGDAVASEGDYAYVTGVTPNLPDENKPPLITLDISNPADIKRLDTLSVPTKESIVEINVDGNHLYLLDKQGKVISYDRTTPAKPKVQDSVEFKSYPNDAVSVMEIEGDSLYVNLHSVKVGIINKSSPSELEIKGEPRMDIVTPYGEIDVYKNNVLVGVGVHGLYTYDISTSESDLPYVNHVASPTLMDLETRGSALLASSYGLNGTAPSLYILDISDPTDPRLTNSLSIGGEDGVGDLERVGDWIYFLNRDSYQIDAMEVSSPDQVVHHQNVIGNGQLKTSFNDYLVTWDRSSDGEGLQIWDASSPGQPTRAGKMSIQNPEKTITDGDSLYVYLNNYDHNTDEREKGIRIYDISDVSTPEQVGFVDMFDRDFFGWQIADDYLYFIPDGRDSLRIYDITNPDTLKQRGRLQLPGSEIENVKLIGKTLYIPVDTPYDAWLGYGDRSPYPSVDILSGLWEINVSDSQNPYVQGIYGHFDSVREPYINENFMVLRNLYGISTTEPTDRAVSISPKKDRPKQVNLETNFPNPFNPSTNIRFSLPKASNVQLTVHNIIGQKVTTLVNQKMTAGSHSETFDASGLPSGVYIYQLKTDGFSESRKMLLVK